MTKSAEADLDAAIWLALKVYRVTCDEPLMLVESIRVAAQAYAAGDSELLTQARRMVLHEATRPKRRPRAALAGGPAGSPADELSPPGSSAMPVVGATLSTGHSVPAVGKGPVKSHPQAPRLSGSPSTQEWLSADAFGAGVRSSKDLSYTQVAQALQELSR